MNDYCNLARISLATWLREKRRIRADKKLGQKAGCFVSLHEKNGQLRGCIGTIEPVREDLSVEIIENAISAGTRDPRFEPVTLAELEDLQLEVSVLRPPEPISGPEELDPRRYGVVIQQGPLRGVLLPDLEGVDSVEQQLSITRRKAGIYNQDPVQLWRFEVERFHEHA